MKETNDLPMPVTLSLAEAAKVAAGSSNLVFSPVESFWWKGQPPAVLLKPDVNIAIGAITVP